MQSQKSSYQRLGNSPLSKEYMNLETDNLSKSAMFKILCLE